MSEEPKKNKTFWGRPKGIPVTAETKEKLSVSIKKAYLKKKKEFEEMEKDGAENTETPRE